MQGTKISKSFHVTGTLAANVNIRFTAEANMTLQQISAVASNDSDATLAAGISSDTDSILVAAVIGDSNTPVTKTQTNWATTNTTGAIAKGDIVVLTLDYDGASGTAAADVTIDLTFTEG